MIRSLFLTICLYLCVLPSLEAQNITLTYSPVRVAVYIDTVMYAKLCQSVPGWWQERMTKIGGIEGRFPVNLTVYQTVGAATIPWAVNLTRDLVTAGQTDVIIMLTLDTIVAPAAMIAETNGIPVIVPMAPSPSLYKCTSNWMNQPPCKQPNTRRFQMVHGMAASAEAFWEPFINTLKIKKARTLAYLQPSASIGGVAPPTIYSEWNDAAKLLSANNKITMYAIPVRFPAPSGESELADITAQLRALNVDAIIGTVGCELYLPYWKKVDFNVKAMVFGRCVDAIFPKETDPKELARYVSASAQWDYRLSGTDYSEYPGAPVSWFPTRDITASSTTVAPITTTSTLSPQQFQDLCMNRTGIAPDYAVAAFAASFEFIEGSVYNWRQAQEQTLITAARTVNPNITSLTITVDRPTLNRQMQLLYEVSFYGILSTNRYGYNQQKELILLQRSEKNINEIVSPISAATIDFIYPMPTWKEREYVHAMFNATEEQILCVLVAIFSVYTLLLCIVMCVHRRSKHVRASSLTFSLIMAFGSIVGYLATLTWPIENNETTCHSRPWLWCLAFQLFFAPLLAKSYRIASIFNVKKFQRQKHDDKLVTWHTFLIAAPQLILLVAWSISSPLQVQVRTPDLLRPVHNFADCDSEQATTFVWLSVAYSAICLLAGCLLAYRVRAAFEMFNDARYIANSVYIFTLTAVVIAAVQAGINSPDQAKSIFIIRSIGTLIAYGSSVSLLLVPRVFGVIASQNGGAYNATKLDDGKHDSTYKDDAPRASGSIPIKSGAGAIRQGHRVSNTPSPMPMQVHVQAVSHDKDDDSHNNDRRRSSTSMPSATPQGSMKPSTRQAFQ